MSRWTHHEPALWAGFGAGGFLAALLLPPLILAVGVLGPARGEQPLFALAAEPWGRLLLAVLLPLCMWHAAHRVFHGLHDLRLPRGPRARWATYGVAVGLSALCGLALVALSR